MFTLFRRASSEFGCFVLICALQAIALAMSQMPLHIYAQKKEETQTSEDALVQEFLSTICKDYGTSASTVSRHLDDEAAKIFERWKVHIESHQSLQAELGVKLNHIKEREEAANAKKVFAKDKDLIETRKLLHDDLMYVHERYKYASILPELAGRYKSRIELLQQIKNPLTRASREIDAAVSEKEQDVEDKGSEVDDVLKYLQRLNKARVERVKSVTAAMAPLRPLTRNDAITSGDPRQLRLSRVDGKSKDALAVLAKRVKSRDSMMITSATLRKELLKTALGRSEVDGRIAEVQIAIDELRSIATKDDADRITAAKKRIQDACQHCRKKINEEEKQLDRALSFVIVMDVIFAIDAEAANTNHVSSAVENYSLVAPETHAEARQQVDEIDKWFGSFAKTYEAVVEGP